LFPTLAKKIGDALARPSQLDPEITNFCPLEGENASRIKG
jgi:hypothetical protein